MCSKTERTECLEKREIENHAHIWFDAKSVNESFARMAVMAFMTDMNPTLDELEDVKTAVSEAVTNAIIHGYEVENRGDQLPAWKKQTCDGQVELSCVRIGQKLVVSVVDHGVGIPNVEEAKQPFFTTKPEQERSGMGFSFMETFMDELDIYSRPGEGTRVTMTKYIGREQVDYIEGEEVVQMEGSGQ